MTCELVVAQAGPTIAPSLTAFSNSLLLGEGLLALFTRGRMPSKKSVLPSSAVISLGAWGKSSILSGVSDGCMNLIVRCVSGSKSSGGVRVMSSGRGEFTQVLTPLYFEEVWFFCAYLFVCR